MQIYLNYFIKAREFSAGGQCSSQACQRNADAVNSFLSTLGAPAGPNQSIWTLPSGSTIETFNVNWDNQAVKNEAQKFGGIQLYALTFGVSQGGGAEKIVAKLAANQVTTANVANMIAAIEKLRIHPDGDSLYNPDFGLTRIGRSNDYPGGSIIALNPYGRIEPGLDFDQPSIDRLIELAKFGGLIAAALFLLSKTNNSQNPPI